MRFVALVLVLASFGCGGKKAGKKSPPDPTESSAPASGEDASEPEVMDAAGASEGADVVAVSTSGSPGSYTFEVTLRSPDTGCDHYANWWEVLDGDGSLVYRRILGHSHTDEQPFTRSGGPVDVAADQEVIVRAHMHPGGYGGVAYRGTTGTGFSVDSSVAADFASEVETAEPQPTGCAF